MSKKKYLTLDDLLLFCKENNFSHFSANEAGGPIVVQTPGVFEATDSSTVLPTPISSASIHFFLDNKN